MASQIEEIKQKIDIVDYISNFTDLKKTGRNFKACCPFHQEKTPSFVVSPERQIWRCFGTCAEGGDVISFHMKYENVTFVEALHDLAEIAGVKLNQDSYDDDTWKDKEVLFTINNLALKYYSYVLTSTKFGEKARMYLSNRGVNEKIVKKFDLGYAPASWNSLQKFLTKKGYSQKQLVDSGLIISRSSSGSYDRFRNRLMFPLKDTRGNVVGFSGRLLGSTAKEAKYVNSPETDIYHKRSNLFGIHLTKDAIRKADNVHVVEGEFDVITPYQNGFENFVAIKGTSLTDEQLAILRRFAQRITLVLDADEAGMEAMKRSIVPAEKYDIDIQIVVLTSGKDPDEALLKDKTSFKKDLTKALPVYDFLIQHAQQKYPEATSFQKKHIAQELSPFINMIQNPIVKSHYIKQIARVLNVSDASVWTLMRQTKKPTKRINNQTVPSLSIPRAHLIQRYFISFLLNHSIPEGSSRDVFKIVADMDFTVPAYGRIFKYIAQYYNSSSDPFDYLLFVPSIPSELKTVGDELYMLAADMPEFDPQELIRIAYEIKINSIKKQIDDAAKQNNPESDMKITSLSQELKEIEKVRKI
ncbi:MAG: DNA primase [bacterium]|nr:DNA primase [bacterium]